MRGNLLDLLKTTSKCYFHGIYQLTNGNCSEVTKTEMISAARGELVLESRVISLESFQNLWNLWNPIRINAIVGIFIESLESH